MNVAIVGIVCLAGLAACTWAMLVFAREPVRGVYCAFFASAILQTPRLPLVREKLTACEIVMILTWLGMLVHRHRRFPLLGCQKSAIAAAVLLLTVTIVSYCASLFTASASLTRSGVETANYVYGFLMFLTVLCLVDTWPKWLGCLYAWCCGSALVSLVGIWSMLGGAPAWTRDDFTHRLSSTLRLSNQLPGYCLPLLVLVLVLAACKRFGFAKRAAFVLLAVGSAASIVWSGSRTGFFLLCLCVPVTLLLAFKERRNPQLSIPFSLTLGTAALIAGFALVLSTFGNPEPTPGTKVAPYERPIRLLASWMSGEGSLDDNRTDQARLVLRQLPENPLLGVGPANFTVTYNTHEVHNTYLGVLAEEGLLGLAALLGWLGAVTYNGCYGAARFAGDGRQVIVLATLIGFAILLIYGLGMYGLRQRPFWLMSALLVALSSVKQTEDRISQIRIAMRGAHRPALGVARTSSESARSARPIPARTSFF